MIFESRFWKDDLLRRADALAKRKTQRRWPEASLAKVEQELMVAAYSIRKLIEATKLSDSVAKQMVPAQSFPPTGYGATRSNWDRIDELFDFSTPADVAISAPHLANQLIHSYVFVICLGEGSLDGFLVSSDYYRNKRLLRVDIDVFIALLRSVGNDYPARTLGIWDEERQDYDVQSWTEDEARTTRVRIELVSIGEPDSQPDP